jgi:hypothetical protein
VAGSRADCFFVSVCAVATFAELFVATFAELFVATFAELFVATFTELFVAVFGFLALITIMFCLVSNQDGPSVLPCPRVFSSFALLLNPSL